MTGSDVIHGPEQAPARDAPLCVNCRYIFDRWYRRRRQFFHTWHISKFHCTPYQLLGNARTCPSCYLLLTKNQETVVKIMESDSDPIGYYEVNNHGDLTQAVALRFKTSSDSNVLCLIYLVEGASSRGLVEETEESPSIVDFVPRIPDEIDDPVTWERIKQWLDTCVKSSSHALCRERILDREIPARLIRILPQESQAPSLHLCPTEDIDDSATIKYAALTHCWGTEKVPFKTTRANLSDMQTKISFDTLGKTFQDAIESCCRLGLEYLWIDSLCIIQDDNDDWEHQASRMGSTYSECALNIVAASSERDSDGFLATRKDRLMQEFATMATVEKELGECEVYACLQPGIPLSDMATSKRAWCFQETFLAPRSVHFHDDGVYWECRTQCAHEIFPTGIHTYPPKRRLSVQAATKDENVSMPDLLLRHGYQGIHLDRAINHRNWFHLIEQYSECQLTYQKDKLVAFAGIARLMSINYRLMHESSHGVQDYLAGLWRIDLHRQLLWTAHRAKARSEASHAPSWSWASTDAKITFPYRDWQDYQTNFEIITATTIPSSKDEYGAVDGGVLQLRCNSLVPVSITTHKEKVWGAYQLFHEKGILSDSTVYLDAEPLEKIELFALTGWKEKNHTHGLLLTPTSAADTFHRVGVYEIGASEPSTTKIKEFRQHQYVPISSILPFKAGGERIIISVV